MVYPLDFIELQFDFAKKLNEKFNIDLVESIFSYTNIYLALTLDFNFNKQNKIWLEFLSKFKPSALYIYDYYLGILENTINRRDVRKSDPFGCFSYHLDKKESTIRLHFSNDNSSGYGPLSIERMEERKRELKEMFTEIRKKFPNAKHVMGKSWLYGLEAYKRLFPLEFLDKLELSKDDELQFLTKWGQFLNSEGLVKKDLASKFLDCVERKPSVKDCIDCFPFEVYTSRVPIENFYDFLGCV